MEKPADLGKWAIVLVDHNIEGQGMLLWSILRSEGWLELYPIQMVMFVDVGLSADITDRELWRFAQSHGMILLTANRNMEGKNSLEQTMREENTPVSLPVLTISSDKRLREKNYRNRCAERLLEIISESDNYLGIGRIFIP